VAGNDMTEEQLPPTAQLDRFSRTLVRGRPVAVELLWIVISTLFVKSILPGSLHRKVLLRLFGAKIGPGVIIKPCVNIKFPWRLTVGAHAWIGENAWIDNLDEVFIGANACISQSAYLCTGNHDWSAQNFDLLTGAITVEDGGWVAARAVIGPGVTVGRNAIVSIGAVATEDVPSGRILAASSVLLDKPRILRPGASNGPSQ